MLRSWFGCLAIVHSSSNEQKFGGLVWWRICSGHPWVLLLLSDLFTKSFLLGFAFIHICFLGFFWSKGVCVIWAAFGKAFLQLCLEAQHPNGVW